MIAISQIWAYSSEPQNSRKTEQPQPSKEKDWQDKTVRTKFEQNNTIVLPLSVFFCLSVNLLSYEITEFNHNASIATK